MEVYQHMFYLSIAIIGVYCDSHTLMYSYSIVLDEESGLPEAYVARYLDDREIGDYSSGYKLVNPMNLQMERNKEVDSSNGKAQIFKGRHPICSHAVKAALRHFNKTEGFQSFQLISICGLRDDGTIWGDSRIGYDGKDFTYLDIENGIWIPTTSEAQISTQDWNSPEITWGAMQRNFLQNECIERLKKYIEDRREELEKKVRPEVKVWDHRHHSDGMRRLQCLVYGFHPRDVDVMWVRNGVDDVPSDQSSPILPHPDGTYQIRVSAEVPTGTEDTYSCHVEHSSLEETLIVKWEPQNGLSVRRIVALAICLPGVVVLLALIGLIVYKYRNQKPDGKRVRNSGGDSEPTSA